MAALTARLTAHASDLLPRGADSMFSFRSWQDRVPCSLFWVPFYGWYAAKLRFIFIDREGRTSALRKLLAQARAARERGESIVIFPEGTRKRAGAAPDYKPGVAALYGDLGQPCAPVALNSGLYWTGPSGFLKRPGKVTVEFLPLIPPGLKRREFMTTLEERIEGAMKGLVG